MANDLPEFRFGDAIAQIGSHEIATVLGVSHGRYFVRWRGAGDSMLWIDEVDRDYVLVDRVGDGDD